jgi:hypothetical protein
MQYHHNMDIMWIQHGKQHKYNAKYDATSIIIETIPKLNQYNLNCFNAYFTRTKH